MSICISEVVSGIRRACERSRSGHVRGLFPSFRSEEAISWSSRGERALLHRLEFDRRVARFGRNAHSIVLRDFEGAPLYRPAFRCAMCDGRQLLLDVASDDIPREALDRLRVVAAAAAVRAGLAYRTVSREGLGSRGLQMTLERLVGLRSRVVDTAAAKEITSALVASDGRGVTFEALATGSANVSATWSAACSLAAKGALHLWPSDDGLGSCRVTIASWEDGR